MARLAATPTTDSTALRCSRETRGASSARLDPTEQARRAWLWLEPDPNASQALRICGGDVPPACLRLVGDGLARDVGPCEVLSRWRGLVNKLEAPERTASVR